MQIYCPIFLDMERKQYICTRQYRYYIEQNPKLKNPNLWHYLLEFLSAYLALHNTEFNSNHCSRYQNNSDLPIKIDKCC